MMSRASQDLPRLPPRNPASHKGDFGRVLLIGGSQGMAGAIALAGMAALRSGAGLVKLAVPETSQDVAAGFEPSYMTVGAPADVAGQFDPAALPTLRNECQWASVVAIGPGLGRSASFDRVVQTLYDEVRIPAVFDADALNALAASPSCLLRHAAPRVLTPHPGELRRLLGADRIACRDDLVEAAHALAATSNTVFVVKGAGTVITDGHRQRVNATGNPGMATGGAGDVLTGVIAGLLAHGMTAFDAARLGAHVHGLAGDLAVREIGETSLIASDLLAHLPRAFQLLRGE